MLDEDGVISTVRHLWREHQLDLLDHDRVYNYVRGIYGTPEVPDGAGDELKDLARLAKKNVLRKVRDSFALPLRVTGFRAPEDESTDAEVWGLWQRQKLDARQAEAHRAAITYGASFAFIERSGIRLRTPRQAVALYADPTVDDWPVYAFETWIDFSGIKPLRRGRLVDDEAYYSVTLGTVTREQLRTDERSSAGKRMNPVIDGDPQPHGFDFTPVARFVNDRDSEGIIQGEIEPVIDRQRAINTVNFDRLAVSRYGAFQQKYAIGWAPENEAALVKASVDRLLAFEDDNIKVGSFPASDVSGYNEILTEMQVDLALDRKMPPEAVTGSLANLAADAIAMARADYEAKLGDKRASFGETWEQVIRAYAAANDVAVSDEAEVTWELDGARSYAQIVDGVSKLYAAGVPTEILLEDIPGWSQQRINAAKAALRRNKGSALVDRLIASRSSGGAAEPDATTQPA